MRSNPWTLRIVFLFVCGAIAVVAAHFACSGRLGPTIVIPQWSLCHNEKAGYEFRYPSEWSVYGDGSSDEGPSPVRTTPCSGFGVSLRDERKGDFTMPVHALPGVTIRIDPFFSDSCKNSNINASILIDGVPFCKVLTNEGALDLIGIHKGKVVTITPHKALSQKILNLLLSTFRFIESPQSL